MKAQVVKMRISDSNRKRSIGILAVAVVLLFSLVPALSVEVQPPTDVSGLVIPAGAYSLSGLVRQ